jgi:beta-glucosidase
VAGTAKIFVDNRLIVDNDTEQTQGDSFFGFGTREELGSVQLEAGRAYKIHIEFGTLPTTTLKVPGATAFGPGGIRVGFERHVSDLQAEIATAVK